MTRREPPAVPPRAPAAAGPLHRDFNDGSSRRGVSDFDLLQAAIDGDAARVAQLLERGASVNMHVGDGETALFIAIRNHDIKTARAVLNKNPDTGTWNKAGNTPVLQAMANNDLEMLKLLLDKGADRETRNRRQGVSPLEYAISMISVSPAANGMFDMLVAAGTKLDGVDTFKMTLTMWAAASDNDHALRVLMQKGIGIHGVNEWNQTPLAIAARNNSAKAAKMLLAGGADIDHADDNGKTARMEAEEGGYHDIVAMIDAEAVRRMNSIIKNGLGNGGTHALKRASFSKQPGQA